MKNFSSPALFCDDCAEVLKVLPDASIDLTVTSPPYDNLREYGGAEYNFETVAQELYRITKHGGYLVWIRTDATKDRDESGTSFRQALYFKEIGWKLLDTMIWEKPVFTDTGSLRVRYPNVFEYMFVFSKGNGKTFHPLMDRPNKSAGRKKHGTVRQKDGTTKPISSINKVLERYGQRFNVWCQNPEMHNRTGHPAVFPLPLAKDHILSWSDENDVILDPFMGSGTTGLACLETGRRFIGIEVNPEYYAIAQNRIMKTEG